MFIHKNDTKYIAQFKWSFIDFMKMRWLQINMLFDFIGIIHGTKI